MPHGWGKKSRSVYAFIDVDGADPPWLGGTRWEKSRAFHL